MLIKTLVVLFLLCENSALSAPTENNEDAAWSFLKESSKILDTHDCKFIDVFFNGEPKNFQSLTDEYTEQAYQRVKYFENLLQTDVFKEMVTASDETKNSYPVEKYDNEELKIGLMNIKLVPKLIGLGQEYVDWLSDDFDNMTSRKNIESFTDKKVNLTYDLAQEILKNTKSSDEILHYWEEWRTKNAEESTKKLKKILTLIDAAAKKYQVTPKYYWFFTFLDEHFLEEMEKVVLEMKPIYTELHGYLRYALEKEYGEKLVSKTGLIPHHLFEHAIRNYKEPGSVISKYFDGFVKLPEDKFADNFSGKNLMDLANGFMMSLGFDDLPSDFWKDRVRYSTNDSCKAQMLAFAPEILLEYCERVDMKEYRKLHRYMAKVHYIFLKKHVTFAAFDSFYLENSLGKAVALSASSPIHLHNVGIRNTEKISPEEDLNRLFQKAFRTIFTIPVHFVHTKLISDILDGSVSFEDMNDHYWKLMKEYVGVERPSRNNLLDEPVSDFPKSFYEDLTGNFYAKKFVSKAVGYQMYESLCKTSEQYVEHDVDHPLHHCNFYGNKDVGKDLVTMMHMGGRQPWRKILSYVTGNESGMSADGIIKYYEPLNIILKDQNVKNNVVLGW